MKMKNPEIEVVRFSNEDVIATSGMVFTEKSYQAIRTDRVSGENGSVFTGWSSFGDPNNFVDGVEYVSESGNVLTIGNWYHYGDTYVSGAALSSSNWLTCTDESHHYSS